MKRKKTLGRRYLARTTYVRSDVQGISPLAERVEKLKDVADRTIPVFGVAIHTTGSTIVSDALNVGADPLAYAIEYYLNPQSYFAHYVVGFDGKIMQISDEHERAPHIGQDDASHQNYISGGWESTAGPLFVGLWKKRWPIYKTPAHLYPGTSPNNCLVPETRVLRADYTWTEIGNVRAGDCLVGFDEQLPAHNRLSKALVLSDGVIKKQCVRVSTTHGTLIAAVDHLFPAASKWINRSRWMRAGDLKSGHRLRYYLKPWGAMTSFDAGWLSGIIDGEGHWTRAGELIVTQKPGVVLDRVVEVSQRLGIPLSNPVARKNGCANVSLQGPGTGLAVVGALRPVRMLQKLEDQWVGRRVYGKSTETPVVLNVEPVGEKWVSAVNTSTRTYIAEGFLSHNCYVGIELLPLQAKIQHPPMAPGLQYSREQHDAVAKLAADIAKRWGFPSGWEHTGRLTTHEDVTPLERMAKGQGWDPGINRTQPWVDWNYLVKNVHQAGMSATMRRRIARLG